MRNKILLLICSALLSFMTVNGQTITPDINGVVYVKQGGSGGADGSSWADATGDFQAAINATGVQQVWVAAGEYQPEYEGSFSMKESIKIYGGFPVTGTPTMDDRDWKTNVTTLKGNGSTVISNNDNSLTVAAVLDGFTITDGVGVNSIGFQGGGISNVSVYPTLSNLVITGNNGYYGGGIGNYHSYPTFTKVTISGNTANYGGGISNGYF